MDIHLTRTTLEVPSTMATTSWMLSNVLGLILVMVLALFLYGVIADIFAGSLPPGSSPQLYTLGPCVVAGLISAIVGGFLTARLRIWLETE